MFVVISYLWILFMLTVLVAPIVAALISRPKRVKGKVAEPQFDGVAGEAAPAEQVLDFGDELAQMDSK